MDCNSLSVFAKTLYEWYSCPKEKKTFSLKTQNGDPVDFIALVNHTKKEVFWATRDTKEKTTFIIDPAYNTYELYELHQDALIELYKDTLFKDMLTTHFTHP